MAKSKTCEHKHTLRCRIRKAVLRQSFSAAGAVVGGITGTWLGALVAPTLLEPKIWREIAENIAKALRNGKNVLNDSQACLDCRRHGYHYMLNDDVWAKIGKPDEIFCLPCAQKRLGRGLLPEDFDLESHLNHTVFSTLRTLAGCVGWNINDLPEAPPLPKHDAMQDLLEAMVEYLGRESSESGANKPGSIPRWRSYSLGVKRASV